MSEPFLNAPAAEAVRLLPYEKAEVHPGTVEGTWILVVSGQKPCLNMKVELVPLVYIQQPGYWGIEVTGILSGGVCLPALAPYHVFLPLDGLIGKKGIEVIGSNRQEKFGVPPGGYASGEKS